MTRWLGPWLVTALVGCAGARDASRPAAMALSQSAPGGAAEPLAQPAPPPSAEPGVVRAAPEAGGGSDADPARRLIIYTARLQLMVANPLHSVKAFRALAEEMGGHLHAQQDQVITVRVPAARFHDLLALTEGMGQVTHRDVQAEDVTRQAMELQLRIDNAERSRERLLTLLSRADQMKDVLEIERELRRLTEEIELHRASLRALQDRVAFSTVTVGFSAHAPELRAYRERSLSPFPWINEVGAEHVLADE